MPSHNFIDITGEKFNRLTVLKREENKGTRAYWLCKCDCGNEIITDGKRLRSGYTKSCGCLQKEKAFFNNKFKHGLADTRLSNIYFKMKSRCTNSHSKRYKDYGGRGITICDEWMKESKNFFEWAINNGYKKDLTLERINNEKGYSPDNCKWATYQDQANNTRRNHLVTIDGESHTIAEWSRITNISYSTIRARIRRGYKGKDLISSNKVKKE